MAVKDPVCGMTIDETAAAATSEHGGRTVYFCSKACQEAYDADPDAYAV